MSSYDVRPGGSLKLKGGLIEGGIKKKKRKSKTKPNEDDTELERERDTGKAKKSLIEEDGQKPGSSSASNRNSPGITTNSDRKTDAEKRFEEAQKKRLAEKVERLAHKTHKDRVSEFNAKLEALSEHHDIPKVGPG